MSAIGEEQLHQIFCCCDPALERDDQVALMLHTVCGLTFAQVARAFLLPTTTIARRLTKARERIRESASSGIGEEPRWEERLGAAMTALYLLFNEGYTATDGDSLIRGDLCATAIQLVRLLKKGVAQPPAELDSLLALMLLHESRRIARVDTAGEPVLLADQDRSLWDQQLIAEGCALLKAALRRGPASAYLLQGAIAAVHAKARRAEETDWRQVVALYERLLASSPSPVVALNHAVAVSMCDGPEVALALVGELEVDLNGYHSWFVVRADLLRRLGRTTEAIVCFERAHALTENEAERRFIRRRLSELRERLFTP